MTNSGGTTFPVQSAAGWQAHGMTLRDYFAAKAMQSLILAVKTNSDLHLLPRGAYELADAMIKERDK